MFTVARSPSSHNTETPLGDSPLSLESTALQLVSNLCPLALSRLECTLKSSHCFLQDQVARLLKLCTM